MSIDYQRNPNGIVTLSVATPDRTANCLGNEFVAAFAAAVEKLATETELQGIILTSAENDFMVGSDIDALYACPDAERAMAMATAFKSAARRFETIGVPTVAALNGSALGGGLELALCCHYRISCDKPSARFGFPEVPLGLIPGGGGSQRLPRLVGLRAALPMMLEGKRYTPAEALADGLIDALVADEAAMLAAAAAWIEANPNASQPWDSKGFRWPGDGPIHPRTAQMWSLAPAVLKQQTDGNYQSQEHILSAVYEGSLVDFDTANRIESRYFAKNVCSPETKSKLRNFLLQHNGVEPEAGPRFRSPNPQNTD